MPKFKVKVTQVIRKTREATIEVEADSQCEATEAVQNGEIDLPSSDSDFWVVTEERLENEEYE